MPVKASTRSAFAAMIMSNKKRLRSGDPKTVQDAERWAVVYDLLSEIVGPNEGKANAAVAEPKSFSDLPMALQVFKAERLKGKVTQITLEGRTVQIDEIGQWYVGPDAYVDR